MFDPTEYLRKASGARTMAHQMADEGTKRTWTQIADDYERMANDRVSHLAFTRDAPFESGEGEFFDTVKPASNLA